MYIRILAKVWHQSFQQFIAKEFAFTDDAEMGIDLLVTIYHFSPLLEGAQKLSSQINRNFDILNDDLTDQNVIF